MSDPDPAGVPGATGTPPPVSPRAVHEERPEGAGLFHPIPSIVAFFDATEEAIRSRLAKVSLLERVFQLNKDWITRITMLMVVASVFWGILGASDILLFESGTTQFALGQPVTSTNQELYAALTLHGVRMLFGFAQQLEIALFGIIFVTAFAIVPRHKWVYYLSVILLNLSMVLMEGPFFLLPQFNDNYFPALGWYFYSPLGVRGLSEYVATPLWYLGWVCLSVAVIIWAVWMLVHLWDWIKAHRGLATRLPAFALFVVALLVLIPLSYWAVLASSLWDLANYFGVGPVDPLTNQVLFWFFGHGIVYILFLIPIVALYFLIPVFAKRPVYSYRAALAAAVIFTVLTPLLSIHHLYLTPVPAVTTLLTSILTYLIIVPSAITFFTLWMTLKGVKRSDWQWNAVTLFLMLAFAGSVAGGLTGVDNNSLAFDIDLHNTMFIVSHFHTMALLSIAAGGFAVVYASFPLLVGRLWYSPQLARLHFLTSAIGWSGLVFYMDLMGSEGILRRALVVPLVAAIVNDQMGLMVFVVLSIGAQLFFVANVLLTLFKGDLLVAQGLSLDEIVRKIAQSTHPSPTVSIKDVPFVRRHSRPMRERAERIWIGSVIVLIIVVIGTTSPIAYQDSSDISTAPSAPAGTEFVTLVGQQYFWSVQEWGSVRGTFANVLVVHADQWVMINATAQGATEGFYLPFRDIPAVDIQVVPGSTSYWLFQAPSVPGVYGAPNSEYNGPWFGQDAAALVVLPSSGTSSLAPFASGDGEGDIYNPPVVSAGGATLVSDNEGLFDNSVPGPTLEATSGPVSFTLSVPFSSIGLDNYLVNVTTTASNGQLAYLAAHGNQLPYRIGIYAINTTGAGLVPVVSTPTQVGTPMVESATLPGGAYLYGLVTPVPYVYDPAGESSWMTGSQQGNIMGLWGVLWVNP